VVEGVALIEADILDEAALRRTLEAHRAEAVIHLAADSLVGESVAEPARYYRTNVLGSLALLGAMRATGVRRLVFSSTAAVYGEPAKQPIEETDPVQPTNPYGETKLVFERALGWHGAPDGLAWLSLRYFNAAGATARNGERHDPETHLIPLVLQAAAGLRPSVTIFGDDYPTPDGTCIRDFIHVHDLARAHVLALETLRDGGPPTPIYNLGCGGRGHSVREVIEAARRVTRRPIPLEVGARRPGDPAVLVASSDRIARDLGWRPAVQAIEAIVESAWRRLMVERPR
jgi:UDP-glucose 4-epimerase